MRKKTVGDELNRLIRARFHDVHRFNKALANAFYRAPSRFLRVNPRSRPYEFREGRTPIIFTAPHGSDVIPVEYKKLAPAEEDFKTAVTAKELAKELGAYYLVAKYSRILVDLNRSPNDLRRKGVVSHIRYNDRTEVELNARASKKEKMARVRKYWKPFHAKLAKTLNKLVDEQLFAYVFDIHFLHSVAPKGTPDEGERRADICMGLCDYEIADKVLALYLKQKLEEKGYEVSVDKPFKGGFVVRNSSAIPQVNAVELELNERIMLNEKKRKKLVKDLSKIIGELVKDHVAL